MPELGRLLTAMVTPFDDRGEVDYERARRLALALLDSGSDGVVVSGTTGESPTLSRDEKLRLFAEIKSAVGDKGSVIAGTGSYNTRESVLLTREAEKIGVDAALLVVPYYNKPTQEGLVEHFKAIAGSTALPCILYNVPSRTITNMTPQTAIALSRINNIVGLKEASADLGQVARILNGAGKDFLVYSGNDSDTFHIISLGGYGVISVASHLAGNRIKEMILKVLNGETAAAAAMHRDMLPLVNALFVLSNPIPVKYALNHVGFNVGAPRLPLLPPDEKSAEVIKAAVERHKVDLPLS
ncbi:MAG: 4-hydroxy-tetrahydrodipicolinate synthase [Dehalococcoidia bacterium]|nr:4-hydroxy-tetrahydrodipicolinate synthase [Dehalococcoidia bacterium]